jgi:adenine deaminase
LEWDMTEWKQSADIIFRNGIVFNPFICEWIKEDFAVKDGYIIGTGPDYSGVREVNLNASYVVPGFIDAHVHIESSLLSPSEYSRLVMKHGTTSVVADPHELANVCGIKGIDYILKTNQEIPLDIFVMLPSCVINSQVTECIETLSADILSPYISKEGVTGIGEMMNVPAVLKNDPFVKEILDLSEIRDGHAPILTGYNLDQYIASGIQSDHETIDYQNGLEKLKKGMFLYIREGSTERNLKTLIPLVNACSSSRCCFCSDDRHTDMLVNSGHIDDCIRKAIDEGCEIELAYRMATLSPSERFRLTDRGALVPGRIADFSLVDDIKTCNIKRTYKKGEVYTGEIIRKNNKSEVMPYFFNASVPNEEEIKISGEGIARIIQIQKGQISTKLIYREIESEQIPDISHDILKVVLVSRYNKDKIGVGLIQGLGLKRGAIASSVSHDSHNIIAVGTSDEDILSAIRTIVKYRGAMVIHDNEREEFLPLEIAGLMSLLPFEEVNKRLKNMEDLASSCGAVDNSFMYLSFLALPVIPEIRITSGGVFDVNNNSLVSLFKNN